MIVSINKQTGKMIEGQSDADAATMLSNAIAMGFDPTNVDVQTVDDATFQTMLAAVNPVPRRKVDRFTVVARLKASGKLAAGSFGPIIQIIAKDVIFADDADVITLLQSIGADPNVILG